MRLQCLILSLSLLLVTTVNIQTRADEPNSGTSLKVTLEKLNRLKKEFKTDLLSSSRENLKNLDSSPISQDLDKSQLVQDVLSQNPTRFRSTESKPTILQSLYVKPESILIYTIGDDPTILIDSNKEPGIVRITFTGTLLDSRFKLSQKPNQPDSAIGSVQVNQISTKPAIVEVIIKTYHKNWQFAPRQGGFILTQTKSPANSVVQSPIPEQESTQPSPSISENVLVPDSVITQDSSSISENVLVPDSAITQDSSSISENVLAPESAITQDSSSSISDSIPIAAEKEIVPTINETDPSTTPPEIPITSEQLVEDNLPIEASTENTVPEVTTPLVEDTLPAAASTENTVPEVTTPLFRQPIRLLNLNTANQLKTGDSFASFGTTQTIRGGQGTGNQTYFTYSDWGLTDDLQVGWAFMINDDPTYNEINGVNIPQQYQSMGPNIKYRFYQDENWSLGILGSLEQFQIYSGPGLFNNQDSPTVSNTLAGTIQLPITYNLSEAFQLTFSPGVNIFSNNLNGVPFYGTIFNVGLGGSWQVFENAFVFANTTIPLSGNNSLNTSRQLFQKMLWSVGGMVAYNKAIAIEAHLSNSFGGTPTTGILTMPTASNEVLLGGSFIMVPSAKEKRTDIILSDRNERLLFDWFTLTTPYILPTDDYGLRLAGDSAGSIGGEIFYSFLQDFQAEVAFASIGGFDTSTVIGSEQGTDVQWRVGGKLVFLNQLDGDFISISSHLTVGREFENKQGYMMVEFPMMYEINPQWAVLFSPKAAINGGNTPVGIGLGVNHQIIPEVQFIAEITPIVTGERTVWAAGFRIFPIKNIAIDLLGTNSTSQFDLGELIAEPGTRFSASIQWRK